MGTLVVSLTLLLTSPCQHITSTAHPIYPYQLCSPSPSDCLSHATVPHLHLLDAVCEELEVEKGAAEEVAVLKIEPGTDV